METIIGFMLPSTFPVFMVPKKTGLFVLTLVGKSISEAEELAKKEGFEPSIRPIDGTDSSWRHFSMTDNGMVIPFVCRVKPATTH